MHRQLSENEHLREGGRERERMRERIRERGRANSCQSLVLIAPNPLESSSHFKLHILCSVRPFSQRQLTLGGSE